MGKEKAVAESELEGEELEGEEVEPTGEEGGDAEDRGDELHPEDKDAAALAAVAGDDQGEDGAAAAPAQPARSGFVPHARFNEVNEELKREREARLRLEEEAARLRGTAEPAKPADAKKEEAPPAFDFDAKEDAYTEALMEGDKATAKAIRKEINEALRKQAEESAARNAEERMAKREQESAAKAAEDAFKAAVVETLEKYPFLNPKDPGANQDAIDEVVALRDLYIRRGKAPAEALREAADKVGKRVGVEADDGGGKSEIDKARERKAAIIRRNAAAAAAQPTSMAGAGSGQRGTKIDGEDLDIAGMSEAEFEKLPESVKARARGD